MTGQGGLYSVSALKLLLDTLAGHGKLSDQIGVFVWSRHKKGRD
jgi:hypothetical protein